MADHRVSWFPSVNISPVVWHWVALAGSPLKPHLLVHTFLGLCFVLFLFELRSHYVAHARFKLLSSSDTPTSAPSVTETNFNMYHDANSPSFPFCSRFFGTLRCLNQILFKGWEDSSMGKVPTTKDWGPEFKSRAPTQNPDAAAYLCNSSPGMEENQQIPRAHSPPLKKKKKVDSNRGQYPILYLAQACTHTRTHMNTYIQHTHSFF